MQIHAALEAMTLGDLAKVYNRLAANAEKPINRFSDKTSGIKRIMETATEEEISTLASSAPKQPTPSLFASSTPKPEQDPIPVPPAPDPSAEESEIVVPELVAGDPERPHGEPQAAPQPKPVPVTEVHFRRALHVRGKQIPLKKTESIRYKSFTLLCRPEGVTVAELEQIFKEADEKRGREPKNTKNRIRDMLSILNQNYGYSIETRKDGSFKINLE